MGKESHLKEFHKIYSWTGQTTKLPEKPRILFVWPTYDQAKYGLIQSLQKWGDVTIYHNQKGEPQYFLPGRDNIVGSAAEIRKLNSIGLETVFRESSKERPYDLLFTQSWGFSFSFDTINNIRKQGCKIVNVCMDDRHLFHGIFAPLKLGSGSLSAYSDLVLTNVPESINLHIEAGARMAVFWPEAAGPDFFYPNCLFSDRDIDVLFVGQNYGVRTHRVDELEKSGVAIKTYGKGWLNGYASDLPSLYQRSKIILGCSEVGYCKNLHHIKMRDFEAPMSGACYITGNHRDLPLIYEPGKEIVVYENTVDLIKKVKELLARPDELSSIANAGLQRASNEHTWEKRLNAVKTLLGKSI